ncbi:MAG: 50S ribosomal protein L35 [Candidatus Dependentiae bacterium]|nr:50S ribosomal protein L35 [Candidatus Dependentiae bacterium]
MASNKMKTNSAAKKRFRVSGGKNGLIKRGKAYRRHLLTKKSAKCKRDLRQGAYVGPREVAHIRTLLPYAF